MTGIVRPEAEQVLRFWLEETAAAQRFAKDAALDAEIATRFGALSGDVQPAVGMGREHVLKQGLGRTGKHGAQVGAGRGGIGPQHRPQWYRNGSGLDAWPIRFSGNKKAHCCAFLSVAGRSGGQSTSEA